MAEERACDICGKVYQPKREGSMYCSAACRQKAKRRRRAPKRLPDWCAPPEASEIELSDFTVGKFQEAHRLANDFGMLAAKGPYQLRARCARISRAIQDALDAEGV